MANLFSYGSVRNKPARSGFDWSEHFSFTAKAGELLPVYWKMLLPGTKVNLNLSSFTRTMPVNTAAFTRVKEYYDWYFVPLRLINKSIGQALVQMQDQPVQATSIVANKSVTLDLPWTNAATMFTLLNYISTTSSGKYNLNGFTKAATSAKLLRYLRYGNCYFTSDPSEVGTNKNFGLSSKDDFNLLAAKNVSFNVLPLAAYQKIYCDWFRFEQWENACPYTYNFDYYNGGNVFNGVTSNPENFWSNDNILSLRYANYNKDLFMGVMPSAQFGSVATVSVSNESNYASGVGIPLVNLSSGSSAYIKTAQGSANPLILKQVSGTTALDNTLGFSLSVLSSSFDILSFRIAEATQKWKEVTQCAKQGYKEQLEAHFNVKLSEALSDHCRYIGGTSSGVTISEVLNTNLDAAPADIKGKGVGGSFGSETFETNEHGILMCIYHAVPVLDYLRSGQDLQLLSTLATDIPIPEFDHIGMEALPIEVLFNQQSTESIALMNNIPVLGYSPRYIAYKTSVDWVSGAFETTLDSWVAPLTIEEQMTKLLFNPGSGSIFSMNYGFFKVTPRVLDPIFVGKCNDTWDSDQFLVNVSFNVKPVQNLDYNGMPY
jgi:hypothetical protein